VRFDGDSLTEISGDYLPEWARDDAEPAAKPVAKPTADAGDSPD